MGILDKKTRFIDLVVTQEGKRQIASGKLRAEFASLSDCNAYYKKGEEEEYSSRIYFEVMERPENSIVLEKDDSGKIINLNMSPTGSIVGNNIFEKDVTKAQSLSLKVATGSDFDVSMNSVLDSSLRHFKQNYFIGTYDNTGDHRFELDKSRIEFVINNSQPFDGSPYKEIINVNDAEPFFLDSKLTHLPNFQFLPPVNQSNAQIGNYTDIRSTNRETWEDISKLLRAGRPGQGLGSPGSQGRRNLISKNKRDAELKSQSLFRRTRFGNKLPREDMIPRQVETIKFPRTSTDNNIILQIYEDSIGPEMIKLDVIDAGVFADYENKSGRHENRVFYVGKVYYDDIKMPTFINIFTIVMD